MLFAANGGTDIFIVNFQSLESPREYEADGK